MRSLRAALLSTTILVVLTPVLSGAGCRITPPGTSETGNPSREDTGRGGDEGGADDTGGRTEGGPCGTGATDGWQPPVGTVVVLVTDGARIDETFGDLESSVSGEATEAELPSYRAKVPAPTMHQRKRKEQGFFSSCDIPMLSTHSVSLSVQDGLTNAVVESVKL